jgi:hypothetical protein
MAWLLLRWRKLLLVCVSCLLGGGFAIALPATPSRTLSNDCKGLLPEVINEPRGRSFPSPPRDNGCSVTSTRSGILAFGVRDAFGPTEHWLYDGDDTEVGHISAANVFFGLYPSTDTFQEVVVGFVHPNPMVESWTDRGELIGRYQLDPEGRDSYLSGVSVTSDVVEGGVFLVYLRIRDGIGWQDEAWRFDRYGTLLFGPIVIDSGPEQNPPHRVSMVGVDVNHNSLLTTQSDGSPSVSAIWFDLGGEIIASREFQTGEIVYSGRELAPLLDGSFVVRRQSGSLRIPAWDEPGDIEPAPQWIEDHPLTDLYFIRGMRGYALAPIASYPECEREISIFAPDGTFCGSFAPEPATYCAPMVIGRDGTVFHPSNDVPPCGAENCTCGHHYWVGLLR